LVVQDKQVDAATLSVSHAMDLLKARDIQTLVDMFHKYLEYE
jgi:hypothetical protein